MSNPTIPAGGRTFIDYPIIQTNAVPFTWNTTWYSNGQPKDLTNHRFVMTLKYPNGATVLVIDSAAETPYVTLGGVEGTISIDVPESVLQAMSLGQYTYDSVDDDGSGNLTPLIGGTFTLVGAATETA